MKQQPSSVQQAGALPVHVALRVHAPSGLRPLAAGYQQPSCVSSCCTTVVDFHIIPALVEKARSDWRDSRKVGRGEWELQLQVEKSTFGG